MNNKKKENSNSNSNNNKNGNDSENTTTERHINCLHNKCNWLAWGTCERRGAGRAVAENMGRMGGRETKQSEEC